MYRLTSRKKVRLTAVVVGLVMLSIAATLVLLAFRNNILFFFGPSEVATAQVQPGQRFRLGGLVKENSVRQSGGGTILFTVTDMAAEVPVSYTGILPDLFREGQGVVAQGALDGNGLFIATEVLAKHDETYMPPEAVEAMKRTGAWREE